MVTRTLTAIVLLSLLVTSVACRSGNGNPDPQPQPVVFSATQGNGTTVRINAPAASADPATAVTAVAGATGQGSVAADGSFSFNADLAQGTSSVSQAGTVTIQYFKDSVSMQSSQTVTSMYINVQAPYFTTGSAPNQMVHYDDPGSDERWLYVANSMSNTVVRYKSDGTVLATASFPEYSSPSYLALADDALWVMTNGDNQATALDLLTLEVTDSATIECPVDTQMAFIGPGTPAWTGSELYIPLAMIEAFGDRTSYINAEVVMFAPNGIDDMTRPAYHLDGHNAQCCLFDESGERLLVTSAGQIQFDENWMPLAESDSYLDIYGPGEAHTAVNLGTVGASRIALDPTGHYAYIGNSLNGNIYKIDVDSGTVVRGIDNPITLTTEQTYISDLGFTPGGEYLLATSFNTDELYVIDPATDTVNPGIYPEPFDLSLDPDLMAGCIDLEVGRVDGDSCWVFVLYGVANSVAVVKVAW